MFRNRSVSAVLLHAKFRLLLLLHPNGEKTLIGRANKDQLQASKQRDTPSSGRHTSGVIWSKPISLPGNQAFQEMGLLVDPFDCDRQYNHAYHHHVRQQLPQELGFLHCYVLGSLLFPALQGEPSSWPFLVYVCSFTFSWLFPRTRETVTFF